MSASFQDWEERDIYVAKRRTEMDAQSVANTTWSTTSSKRLPMHRDSTQIENLLNPVRGIRDAQMRRALLCAMRQFWTRNNMCCCFSTCAQDRVTADMYGGL